MQDKDDDGRIGIEAPGDELAPETQPDGEVADEVARLQAMYEEEHDRHLRAVAELQNFKRRTTRDQTQRMQFANQELLSQIIPVMDNLRRALDHEAHADSGDFARGVELVVGQFHEMLASFGVQAVVAEGQPFDPQLHEAVAQVETDEVPEGTVVAVDTPGYCLHDRCLRPAKVVVARAPGEQRG